MARRRLGSGPRGNDKSSYRRTAQESYQPKPIVRKKRTVELNPRNNSQKDYVDALLDYDTSYVFGIGPAGTGKTLMAVLVAIKAFNAREIDKIVITRPAVSADEDLGFLPGTLEEKMAPWTRPIFDILKEYFTAEHLSALMAEGVIEIAPLAYMRGRTFKNAYILADEMQNATPNQMKMLLTRLGEGSQMAITGDLAQADSLSDNGLIDFIRKIEARGSSKIEVIEFGRGDVERHEAVKEVLEIYGDE